MICTTVRNGQECPFMKKDGCSYRDGSCLEAVEACKGCARTIELESGWYCSVSPDPLSKWKHGICNMATHVKRETMTEKPKLNPIKASKRARGK